MALGRWLGRALLKLGKRRWEVASINIDLCFPNLNPEQKKNMLRQTYESAGMGVMETAICWWWPTEKTDPLLVRVEGEAHLEDALSQGRGALLLASHLSSLEMGTTLLASRRLITAVYRPHKNALVNWMMNHRRASHGEMIPRENTRQMLRALKKNLPMWYAPDQNFRSQGVVFAPFFGVDAATAPASHKLARISKAPVVPFYQRRLKNDGGYELVFLPALENFPGDDPAEDTARINKVIESMVREQPSDYLWIHRRFKTRPPGEPKIYPKR